MYAFPAIGRLGATIEANLTGISLNLLFDLFIQLHLLNKGGMLRGASGKKCVNGGVTNRRKRSPTQTLLSNSRYKICSVVAHVADANTSDPFLCICGSWKQQIPRQMLIRRARERSHQSPDASKKMFT